MNRRVSTRAIRALWVLVAAALASCAQTIVLNGPVPTPRDITQGDTFALLQPIAIAKGRTAVNLQGGQLVEDGGIAANSPYCRLELAGPAPANLTLQPQQYSVTAISYDDRAQGRPGGTVATTYITLNARSGGESRRLACGWPGASGRTNFPTGDDIGSALGGYFSIGVAN